MAVNLTSDKGTGLSGRVDTLAQSFFIDRTVFITKLDLFFSQKDGNRPVEVSIRKIENDSPSANIIQDSLITIDIDDINVSSNSNVATTVQFNQPILVESGQYCFVLSSDTKDNKVYTASLGGQDIQTGAMISKQPYSGVMFMSSNGDFWTIDQTRDIKFNLYVAKFQNTTGVLDLKVIDSGLDKCTMKYIDKNDIKSYTGKSILKINQENHGLTDGRLIRFNALLNDMEYVGNANADIKINGIDYTKLSNVVLTVSNVTSTSYTVDLGTNTADTANITGGNFPAYGAQISRMIPFSTVVTGINEIVPLKAKTSHKIKTTDTTLTVGNYESIESGELNYSDTQVLVDEHNRNISMSGAESISYRIEMKTNDDYISPVISIPSSSLLLVSPDINEPSITDTLDVDEETICSANANVSFTYSDTTGYINCSAGDIQANIRTMAKGSYVTITGSGNANNNGTFRIVDVSEDGSTFQIPNVVTEGEGNSITIVNKPLFIDDRSSFNTSSRSKYLTRKVNLSSNSTAFNVRFTLSKPAGSSVEVYYKTQTNNPIDFENKEYRQLDLGTIPNTLNGQYLEIESTIDGLTEFDAFVFKFVFKSNNIAIYPKIADLRIIALE